MDGDIHIEYWESYYDGDSCHVADITFSYPGKPERNLTVHYEDDSHEFPTEQRVAKDIVDYMQEPAVWIDAWIRQGPDNVMKLRRIEDDIREHTDSLASSQCSVDYNTKMKQELEQEAEKIRKTLSK
jgi:hypothetical protein